jgi:hypothetical protein
MYTAAEYAEMLIIYGECRRNAREDAREYAIGTFSTTIATSKL